MPPLATSMVDQHAAARLQSWIDEMEGCPETTSRPASVNRHAAAPATALLAERAAYEERQETSIHRQPATGYFSR